jgi:hypothetical protein
MAARAVVIAAPGQKACMNRHRQGWACTRLPGHTGEHVATGDLGTIYRRWRGGRATYGAQQKEQS